MSASFDDARHELFLRGGDDVLSAAAASSHEPVVISIARDYGAEGHEVGKLLSERLGIPLYDNELLVRSALRSGIDVDQIATYDERAAHGPLAFLPDAMDQSTRGDRVFKAIRQVIIDLASSQDCIVEGRLSDYILRGSPNLITVLVTAPLACRVKIVGDKRGLKSHEAMALVRRMQHQRERFYTRYSAGKWDMYMDKDLIVDRSVFGVEGCCDIIAAAYQRKVRMVR